MICHSGSSRCTLSCMDPRRCACGRGQPQIARERAKKRDLRFKGGSDEAPNVAPQCAIRISVACGPESDENNHIGQEGTARGLPTSFFQEEECLLRWRRFCSLQVASPCDTPASL